MYIYNKYQIMKIAEEIHVHVQSELQYDFIQSN